MSVTPNAVIPQTVCLSHGRPSEKSHHNKKNDDVQNEITISKFRELAKEHLLKHGLQCIGEVEDLFHEMFSSKPRGYRNLLNQIRFLRNNVSEVNRRSDINPNQVIKRALRRSKPVLRLPILDRKIARF